ncbi:MAG TPA: hypothetical protein VLH77_04355 [Gammaproteobacteria bacterium]|nr:hypothetical protein [Gammaproteobacteria bacterium]
MFASKNARSFKTICPLKGDEKNKFSHSVEKIKKEVPPELAHLELAELPQKYQNIWYAKQKIKKEEKEEEAKPKPKPKLKRIAQELLELELRERELFLLKLEIVSQELFRLFIPGHPKTRLLVGEENQAEGVISKEVEGCRALPPEGDFRDQAVRITWNAALRSGDIRGLGEIMVIALLLNEIDLRTGNLLLNHLNQIIKIDGDWCFAKLKEKILAGSNFQITENEIASLPFPGNYAANNWIGIIFNGKNAVSPWDPDLSTNPFIRAEVNYALLKVLILPNLLFVRFIQHYARAECIEIFNELMLRKSQLSKAALKNNDFHIYLNDSEQVQKGLLAYLEYLKTFKMTGKNFIFQEEYELEIWKNLDKLLKSKGLPSEWASSMVEKLEQSKNLNSSRSNSPLLQNRLHFQAIASEENHEEAKAEVRSRSRSAPS